MLVVVVVVVVMMMMMVMVMMTTTTMTTTTSFTAGLTGAIRLRHKVHVFIQMRYQYECATNAKAIGTICIPCECSISGLCFALM